MVGPPGYWIFSSMLCLVFVSCFFFASFVFSQTLRLCFLLRSFVCSFASVFAALVGTAGGVLGPASSVWTGGQGEQLCAVGVSVYCFLFCFRSLSQCVSSWTFVVRLVVELIIRVWKGGCWASRVWGAPGLVFLFPVWALVALSILSTLSFPPLKKKNN